MLKKSRAVRILPFIVLVSASCFFGLIHLHRASAQIVDVISNPLDPLKPEEIDEAIVLLKKAGKVPEGSLFPIVSLKEPPKEEILKFHPGDPYRREVFAVVYDRPNNKTFEAVIDLKARNVASIKEIPGVQPLITNEELDAVPKLVRADPEWRKAINKRGITDYEGVMIDPWAPGTLAPEESPKTRWIRALAYWRGTNHNGYARPIEGVVALVNMNERRVERVLDLGVHPVPQQAGDLDEKSIGTQRHPPKPLVITMPEGPSFEVRGHEIVWQKWHFRFGMQPREGLILYQVGYEDKGKVRPILYKASLAEMVVPYGDTAKNWTWRNAFDEGEYGIGRLVDSMEVGADCPEYATTFDATFADDFGKSYTVRRAVALYERDGGLLWKHYEFYTGQNESRRSRELVISSIMTTGNYDYGFNWIFRQDGTIELQAQATGIMLPKGVDAERVGDFHAGRDGRHWHLVGPHVAAPHHQHFFNFRLDWDVDGQENNVGELNVHAMPEGAANPEANGFMMDVTPLKREWSAERDIDVTTSRKWIVTNSTAKNILGYPTGYALVPGDNSFPYVSKDSKVRKRAAFINHHLWVTPYDPEEMHAAGEYPNQGKPWVGLPQWTTKNRSIENKDIVMWYTFGLTHTPRPEEWPVMDTTTIGFKLLPVGFFDRNPALDVPHSKAVAEQISAPVAAPAPKQGEQ